MTVQELINRLRQNADFLENNLGKFYYTRLSISKERLSIVKLSDMERVLSNSIIVTLKNFSLSYNGLAIDFRDKEIPFPKLPDFLNTSSAYLLTGNSKQVVSKLFENWDSFAADDLVSIDLGKVVQFIETEFAALITNQAEIDAGREAN